MFCFEENTKAYSVAAASLSSLPAREQSCEQTGARLQAALSLKAHTSDLVCLLVCVIGGVNIWKSLSHLRWYHTGLFILLHPIPPISYFSQRRQHIPSHTRHTFVYVISSASNNGRLLQDDGVLLWNCRYTTALYPL